MKTSKLIVACLAFFIAACSSSGVFTHQNLAYLYQPKEELDPEYFFYHITDTLSEFWFKIPASQLVYESPSEKLPASTNARLSIRLFVPEYPSVIKDTATIHIKTSGTGRNGFITGSFGVRTNAPELIAEVNLWDLNKGAGKKNFISTSRKHAGQREYYLLKDTAGNVLFDQYFNASTQTVVVERTISPVETIETGFHLNEFPFPAPPFSQQGITSFPFKAFQSATRTINDTLFNVDISKEGFYHIRTDTTSTAGLTLFQMGGDFPAVTSETQLLDPLRYLTSSREFLDMKNSDNVKQAVDRFWLKAGGSPEKAKEMIRKFYGRVARSNALFSSYTEGWKTDRGMVYLIFGPPDIVHRSLFSETWVYGEEKSSLSMKLIFAKLQNPFTPRDYSLNRSELFRNNWYRAVETWREGRGF